MFKKLSVFVLCFSFSFLSFANPYQIKNEEFDINGSGFKFFGKTNENSFLLKFPVDKKTVFSSLEDFEVYLENYKKTLENSRNFEYVDISYETDLETPQDENGINSVHLKISLVDSHHFIMMPYGKYSSNTGLSLKLKIRDSNFLGSLNEMSSEVVFSIKNEGLEPGISFSYDYPFKLSNVNLSLVNDYSLSYLISNESPEWDLKTGLKLSIPVDLISFVFEFYQHFSKELDYTVYEDSLFFTEEAAFSTPLTLHRLPNYTDLIYTPKISFKYNWDFDGINIENDSLSSPELTFENILSNSNVNWNECFRDGYSFNLKGNLIYNIQRNDLVPFFEFEGKFYKSFNFRDSNFLDTLGVNLYLDAYTYVDLPCNDYIYGDKIGEKLRGALDNIYFGNLRPVYTASSAILFSIDLPLHLFTTNFSMEILNFNMQLSPFFDFALVHDRNNDTFFSFKDAFYCPGLEILVYPLKWSSYTFRVSVGFNLREALQEDNILKGLFNNKEIFFGIGLQY